MPAATPEQRAAQILLLRRSGFRSPRLLAAFESAPRALFVTSEQQGDAARDIPLPLPCGQTLERPSQLARLLDALEIDPAHSVLEIGAGCGWLSALLAHLAKRVVALERYATLARLAQTNCKDLNNTVIEQGDGTLANAAQGVFDRIVVSGSVAEPPDHLTALLKPEGRMALPLESAKGGLPQLAVFTRGAAGLTQDLYGPHPATPLEKGCAAAL